jgi:hypothetical protein
MYAVMRGSKFIDGVPQIVGLRAAQFMTQLLEPHQTGEALVTRFDRQAAKPVKERNDIIVLLEEDDLRRGHLADVRTIANIRQPRRTRFHGCW